MSSSGSELNRSYTLILMSTIIYSMLSLSQWAISINFVCIVLHLLQMSKIVPKFKVNFSILVFLVLNILVLVGCKDEPNASLIQAIMTLYLSTSLLLEYRRTNYQISLVSSFLLLGLASRQVYSTLNIVILIIFYSLITWTLFQIKT